MNVTNRAGLAALRYRAGTYASFFEAMRARLSSADLPDLTALSTRDLDDPSIALLDGWAVLADVLTFYQERIANEGFLRTATERRSVVELARLVGYALRPGVAAGVFLAYTLEKTGDVTIPVGSKAQSVPAPGQMPQTFETAEALAARADRNVLGIRMTRSQRPAGTTPFYVKGTATLLKPNDLLLITKPDGGADHASPEYQLVRIQALEVQPATGRTKVALQAPGIRAWAGDPAPSPAPGSNGAGAAPRMRADDSVYERFTALRPALLRPPAPHPRTALDLPRSLDASLGPNQDAIPQLIASFHPGVSDTLYAALATVPVAAQAPLAVSVFRARSAPFGHNAPQRLLGYETGPPPPPPTEPEPSARRGLAALVPDARRIELALLAALHAVLEKPQRPAGAPQYDEWPLAPADRDAPASLSLDARFDKVVPGGHAVVKVFGADPMVFGVEAVDERSRSDYGITGTSTVLALDRPYFVPKNATLATLRAIDVYAQDEPLELVDVPMEGDVAGATLELDGLYDHLQPGRWAIVTGMRTDLQGVVAGAEVVMIAASEHAANPDVPGDAMHTFVTLSHALAYTYDRGTVAVYGNVVRATHGETKRETLGSGDAGAARQHFALKSAPLTYVAAPTTAGVASSLSVSVNGVLWSETDDPDAASPADRVYTTSTDDAGVTTVTFGDGVHGARVPSGAENVTAVYRAGIGTAGNVDAGRITLLASRPLGVKAVLNPRPAAGGADPESRDDARGNVPTALLALDRLVSLADYADFVRTFAGVAKADVARIGAGGASLVVLTVAGAADAPFDPHGDLAAGLTAALRARGDPAHAFALVSRRRVAIALAASVALEPGALWDTVAPAVRAALERAFAFARRDFGQPAYKSEAIAAIAGVDGVANVDVTAFTGVRESELADLAGLVEGGGAAAAAIVPRPAGVEDGTAVAAEIVALDPAVGDTVILQLAGAAAS